jgi:hypothetical protein
MQPLLPLLLPRRLRQQQRLPAGHRQPLLSKQQY